MYMITIMIDIEEQTARAHVVSARERSHAHARVSAENAGPLQPMGVPAALIIELQIDRFACCRRDILSLSLIIR